MKRRSCSWCHEMVSEAWQSCPNCGHDAWSPMADCRCNVCRRAALYAIDPDTLRKLSTLVDLMGALDSGEIPPEGGGR